MDNCTMPDYSRAALLTIDMQNDFTLANAPLEVAGTREIIPRIHDLVLAFRRNRKPIVHVVRLYLSDGSNADPCRRKSIENGKLAIVPDS